MHFVINFVSKSPRKLMFEGFKCIISMILCKSCCRSNCFISFSVAVMTSRVTASGSGMFGVLAVVLFFHSFCASDWGS